ncbi:hypothetical protein B0J13DRAFT_677569 [Dactylonectria estremocensis]|uniref:CBM-cenC domain-containing protein n=1 Tax=Dactylonectria estremocensis TaxID=1079267 RepID=A0A9P9IYC3_9HYPO|nr:hypothetical protein B0J13DRAFT_677569 [Dactylonectria estremocensis]
MIGNLLFTGALIVAGVGAAVSSPRQVYQRAGTCNRDNLFRCFIDSKSSVQASDFCSNLSPFTTTVATTIATTTETVHAQTTIDGTTSIVTSTTTVFTQTIPTSTTTLTLAAGTVAKRDATASPPKCMTNGVTYPASRITSACSCIDVPVSTVSVTATLSTETVTQTEISTITAVAVVTSWETVLTATTGGVYTATVGPPSTVNRIVNGDFETGNANGWELVPASWQGTVSSWNAAPSSGSWSYLVTGSSDSLGLLRQVQPIYLEAGQYVLTIFSNVLLFPQATAGWGSAAVFEILNPTAGTNTTLTLNVGVKKVMDKKFVIYFTRSVVITEEAAGFNNVAIRYITHNPPVAAIDGISLEKA